VLSKQNSVGIAYYVYFTFVDVDNSHIYLIYSRIIELLNFPDKPVRACPAETPSQKSAWRRISCVFCWARPGGGRRPCAPFSRPPALAACSSDAARSRDDRFSEVLAEASDANLYQRCSALDTKPKLMQNPQKRYLPRGVYENSKRT